MASTKRFCCSSARSQRARRYCRAWNSPPRPVTMRQCPTSICAPRPRCCKSGAPCTSICASCGSWLGTSWRAAPGTLPVAACSVSVMMWSTPQRPSVALSESLKTAAITRSSWSRRQPQAHRLPPLRLLSSHGRSLSWTFRQRSNRQRSHLRAMSGSALPACCSQTPTRRGPPRRRPHCQSGSRRLSTCTPTRARCRCSQRPGPHRRHRHCLEHRPAEGCRRGTRRRSC
mmetsp:Transcript_28774/g.73877  ORF Transcript_28774/g.73877 Transcript_28774/m.73877 type:complete len:229 (+) Transcript_28774:1152-1838(+)